jgi:hypothetical protein
MSFKFVQSSDNKYVRCNLLADSFTTDTTQWAVDDAGVYIDNPEFITVKLDKKGKLLWAIKADGSIYYGAGVPQQIIDYIQQKIAELSLDEYEDIVAFLGSIINKQPIFSKKKVSIIGDSISTFAGYIPNGYSSWYPHEGDRSSDVTSVNDTWWKKLLDATDSSLEVNASWSGSRVTTLAGVPNFDDRVSVIGNPEVIIIALGTNDSNNNVEIGDIDFNADSYDLTKFAPAYIKGLQDILATYPNARIICIAFDMGVTYQHTINAIANHYGIDYIYVGDISDIHPNKAEMQAVYERIYNTWSLAGLLSNKVDKVKGMSLIDEDVASSIHYVENPEYIEAKTDANGKVIEATRKDATKLFGAGVEVHGNMNISGVEYFVISNPEWLAAWVDSKNKVVFGFTTDGKTFVGDADFLDVIKTNSEAVEYINSLIGTVDWEGLRCLYIEDNAEYISVELDSKRRVLGGRKADGTKVENISFETPKLNIDGTPIENIYDPEERIELNIDSKNKIVSWVDKEGKRHEEAGVVTKSVETESVTTNSLELTPEGMTDFQSALKNSGFNPGGADDYSERDSMYISEPRLAHLNIISDIDMTTLTKAGMQGAVSGVNYDVPVQVEYSDDKGNYFKKYALLSGQGRSSLSFIKKGLSLDFFNEDPNDENFDEDNTFSIKFGDWVPQDSFHIKSFYTDWPRCTTPVVYKLTNEVLLTRGVMEDRPYKKYYVDNYSDSANANSESDLKKNMETGARCVPDGFPVIVYQNGEFWGVNSWQLKKHRDNYFLNKKKDSNIHLDGDMGVSHLPAGSVPFWLWNGTINWTIYCHAAYGIETRNPKNLYCIDGKKYDADTHNMEIIDTATAESWIASGVITPTGKTINSELAGYLRTTGKVRKNIEDLTTFVPYINSLISGGSSTADIKAAIEDRFDVNSFIDYILINNVVGNRDCWDNNGQIVTWGKLGESSNLNWSANVYDCDVTFGCRFDGLYAVAPDSYKHGDNYPVYSFFWDYYYDELQARYHELRDKGIFDANHITGLFRSWMDRVGYDNYDKEYKKWPESPCFRDGTQTYENYPTTGGMYGSIYRIYLWIKKRIEYMDAADFFNYNQN